MADPAPDYYELLQISPRAEHDTIQRVFKHLAKRFHPDNSETGSARRFEELVEAVRVLSNPVERARYDLLHVEQDRARWRIFDQQSTLDDVASDRRLRTAILSILYTARRNDAERPGVGQLELEELLQCPEEHMRFHVWYLKENGLINRTESGALAITASGVDFVLNLGGPAKGKMQFLESATTGSDTRALDTQAPDQDAGQAPTG